MVINWPLDGVILSFIKQRHRTDCGIACISMVLDFYQCNISYQQIVDVVKVDKKKGINLAGIVDAMAYFGFEAEAVRGEREVFFSEYPLPCIALIQFQTGATHYVVVYERSRDKIVIADPAIGIITLKPEEFLDGKKRKWFAARYHWTGILILLKRQ